MRPSRLSASRYSRSPGSPSLSRARARAWTPSAQSVPLALVAYAAALYPFTPSIGDIKKSKQESPTVVLSADGKELAVFRRANRDWVKLSDVSPKVVEALLSTVDKRFYDHHGIDFFEPACERLVMMTAPVVQAGAAQVAQAGREAAGQGGHLVLAEAIRVHYFAP